MIYVLVGLVVFQLYISIDNVVTVYFYALSIKSSCLFSFGRGGRAGGYKELDEEEIEETKRRRKEAEEVALNCSMSSNDSFYESFMVIYPSFLVLA